MSQIGAAEVDRIRIEGQEGSSYMESETASITSII